MNELEVKAALEEAGKQISTKQAELKTAIETQKTELKKEIDELEAKRAEMQKQLDQIATDLKKQSKTGEPEKEMTFTEALKSIFKSEEFKNAQKNKFKGGESFEVKSSLADITGVVNLTQAKPGINFAPTAPLAFIGAAKAGGVIGQDKNRILWVEGAYTSNCGYVGEGTGQATADAGTVIEKSREMAKISAKLPITAELMEDASQVASQFRMKLQEKALAFADSEIYGGNGADGGANKNHIYGIKGQATAYDPTTTGSALLIPKANIGDLVDDMVLQAELSEQKPDTLWINPKDFAKFRYAKDANGNYLFVKDVNGNYTISGLNVIKSTKVTANTLTIADSAKIQLWWKRYAEVKFSQMNGTDFVDDAYTAVLFLRCQCLIETPDQTAVIHVADIASSITAITQVTE